MKKNTKYNCIIIFSGHVNIRILRTLRPGYRHCFIVLKNNNQNIIIDTMSHRTSIDILDDKKLEFTMRCCMDMGYTVLKTFVREPKTLACTLRPHTCVEAAKRLIGIQDGRILSPWQLYQKVRPDKNRKKILLSGAVCAIHG